jgi:VWFA-related protein
MDWTIAGTTEVTRTLVITLLAVATFAHATATVARQQTPQRPVFQAGTDSVVLDIAVRRNGDPVLGLTLDEFEILDNGVRQTADHFSAEAFPLDLTLLIDRSGHTAAVIDQFKSAAAAVTALLGDDDRVRILGFSTTVKQIFEGQPVEVPDVLASLQIDRALDLSDKGYTTVAGPPTMPPAAVRGVPQIGIAAGELNAPVPAVQALGTTSVYDAIVAALVRRRAPDRRALVVAYTGGIDDASTISPDILKDVARRADVVLDMFLAFAAFDPTGGPATEQTQTTQTPPARPQPQGQFDDSLRASSEATVVLRAAAEATGGSFDEMLGDEQVTTKLKSALLDFKARYTLSYTIRGLVRPGWHDIGVKIKNHPDYKVLVRKGYDGGK